MGVVKLGLVVFGAFAFGGRVGLGVYNAAGGTATTDSSGRYTDSAQGAIWAGRAVMFLALGYVASKV